MLDESKVKPGALTNWRTWSSRLEPGGFQLWPHSDVRFLLVLTWLSGCWLRAAHLVCSSALVGSTIFFPSAVGKAVSTE